MKNAIAVAAVGITVSILLLLAYWVTPHLVAQAHAGTATNTELIGLLIANHVVRYAPWVAPLLVVLPPVMVLGGTRPSSKVEADRALASWALLTPMVLGEFLPYFGLGNRFVLAVLPQAASVGSGAVLACVALRSRLPREARSQPA